MIVKVGVKSVKGLSINVKLDFFSFVPISVLQSDTDLCYLTIYANSCSFLYSPGKKSTTYSSFLGGP